MISWTKKKLQNIVSSEREEYNAYYIEFQIEEKNKNYIYFTYKLWKNIKKGGKKYWCRKSIGDENTTRYCSNIQQSFHPNITRRYSPENSAFSIQDVPTSRHTQHPTKIKLSDLKTPLIRQNYRGRSAGTASYRAFPENGFSATCVLWDRQIVFIK